jgi:hypothetical protein
VTPALPIPLPTPLPLVLLLRHSTQIVHHLLKRHYCPGQSLNRHPLNHLFAVEQHPLLRVRIDLHRNLLPDILVAHEIADPTHANAATRTDFADVGCPINLGRPGIGINHQRDDGKCRELGKGNVGWLIATRIALMGPFLAVKLEEGVGHGLGLGYGSGLMHPNALLGIRFIKSLYKRFKIWALRWTDHQFHAQVHPEAHEGRWKIIGLGIADKPRVAVTANALGQADLLDDLGTRFDRGPRMIVGADAGRHGA